VTASTDLAQLAARLAGRLSSPSLDPIARFWLPIGAAAVAATVSTVGWNTQPDRLVRGYAPEQPIPFSHRLHAGVLKIPCEYCHAGVRRTRQAGVPPLDTCMNCHKVTKADQPVIQRLAALHASGEPIVWKRIHALPDHVFFDHRPHVGAGVACQTCHGEVETTDVVSQHMSMRMGNCLGCHRSPQAALPAGSALKSAAESCNVCHR
jgi:hypothetical protein